MICGEKLNSKLLINDNMSGTGCKLVPETTFKRGYNKSIVSQNVENYLYGTMQNLFGVWWNKQAAREYAAKHPEEEKPADNDNSGLYYQS